MNPLSSLTAGSEPSFAGLSAPTPGGASLTEHRDFESILGIARGAQGATAEQAARAAAEQLVAATFIEPMLKSVRESSMAAEPFKPTSGELQFRALTDRRLAHEVVKSARMPIVDRLASDLLKARPNETGGPA